MHEFVGEREKQGSARGKKNCLEEERPPRPLKNLPRTTNPGNIRPLERKFRPAPDISGLGPEISGLGRKFRPRARKYLDKTSNNISATWNLRT